MNPGLMMMRYLAIFTEVNCRYCLMCQNQSEYSKRFVIRAWICFLSAINTQPGDNYGCLDSSHIYKTLCTILWQCSGGSNVSHIQQLYNIVPNVHFQRMPVRVTVGWTRNYVPSLVTPHIQYYVADRWSEFVHKCDNVGLVTYQIYPTFQTNVPKVNK